MLSKMHSHNIPYICAEPLSAETESITIPVYIMVKGKNFEQAINTCRQTMKNMPDYIGISDDGTSETFILDNEQEFDDIKPVMELSVHNDNEYQAHAYNYVIIKFRQKGRFWERMNYIAATIDKLYEFAHSYKSDKHVSVNIGAQFGYHK